MRGVRGTLTGASRRLREAIAIAALRHLSHGKTWERKWANRFAEILRLRQPPLRMTDKKNADEKRPAVIVHRGPFFESTNS
jgi:hypothetical protein